MTQCVSKKVSIPARDGAGAVDLYIELEKLKGNRNGSRSVIFLLPGGPGADHGVYKRHSADLAEFCDLVYMDPRGCGKSSKDNPANYTLENHVQDVEQLRIQLGFEKIIVLGTSYGGIVAQRYALRYPQTLEKLILVVTAPSYRFMQDAKKNLQNRGTPEQIKLGQKLWQANFTSEQECLDFFRALGSLYSYKVAKEGENASAYKDMRMSPESLNLGFSTFLKTFDFEPELKNINCPTLVLAGELDWICDPKHSKVIASKIPNASLKIYPDCAHAIAMDQHENYIKAVRDFIFK